MHFMISLATEHKIDISAGTIVERIRRDQDDGDPEKGGDKLFNTAYYISREGKVLGRYRKRNLW
jgi:predicted amidohydrolase